MSGFWKKGYYILCFIVRTLYNLLSLEKKPKIDKNDFRSYFELGKKPKK